MERTWTNIGNAYNSTDEQKAHLSQAFASLQWQEIGDGLTLPMMPAEGIKSAIKTLRLPKVSHVAVSHELAPYGLYGIRSHYKNGRADVYLIDEGSSITVLASDFYPIEEPAKVS